MQDRSVVQDRSVMQDRAIMQEREVVQDGAVMQDKAVVCLLVHSLVRFLGEKLEKSQNLGSTIEML